MLVPNPNDGADGLLDIACFLIELVCPIFGPTPFVDSVVNLGARPILTLWAVRPKTCLPIDEDLEGVRKSQPPFA